MCTFLDFVQESTVIKQQKIIFFYYLLKAYCFKDKNLAESLWCETLCWQHAYRVRINVRRHFYPNLELVCLTIRHDDVMRYVFCRKYWPLKTVHFFVRFSCQGPLSVYMNKKFTDRECLFFFLAIQALIDRDSWRVAGKWGMREEDDMQQKATGQHRTLGHCRKDSAFVHGAHGAN